MKKRRRAKEIVSRDAQPAPPQNTRFNAQRRKVLATHYAARYRAR